VDSNGLSMAPYLSAFPRAVRLAFLAVTLGFVARFVLPVWPPRRVRTES
jgi:hypothetical protein